ncbi:hypothetical protein Hoch_5418 [Haliangium ochraceum DSM 14365]|uniref:Uncharacterized protein n=2 Tax=Haliangium ochraceum TaxID=80816 RepID=D0LYN6_HALO1|nr:hypothetical protein Hoch_5418 [Haliangium ochraceum DSM 14365]
MHDTSSVGRPRRPSPRPPATPAERRRARLLGHLVALLALTAASSALAMPAAPALVCESYPSSALCTGQLPACTLCHTTPPVRNAFGAELEAALAPGESRPLTAEAFAAALPDALAAVESGDTDDDGFTNLDELLVGTALDDADSKPSAGDGLVCEDPKESWAFDVCDRDPAYTFAKVLRDTCGRSPTLAEIDELYAFADPWQHIHATLDTCVQSEYWQGKDGVLWQLAHRKIQPSASIKAGENAGVVPLADYFDDYNLFVYTQTGDRDARELLTAQYMVERSDSPSTSYQPYTRTVLQDVAARGTGVAQLVAPERRAGMITTRWFLMTKTMFTQVPRTSAAQAYRAYLGMDIAKLEGLKPVSAEPIDYDAKGVAQTECAGCHSTLDPLTYPFTRYEGLGAGNGAIPASYNPERMERFVSDATPDIGDTPEAGVVLGQEVSNLLEWAEVAANSDEFARATVLDYWKLLVGVEPGPSDNDRFTALWQAFTSTHDYRINRMLHELIETEAYSVP